VATLASSIHRNLIRTTVLFAVSVLVLLGFVPRAHGAKVGYSSDYRTIYYLAQPGEANDVKLTSAPDAVLISDPKSTLSPDKGCVLIDSHNARCSGKFVNWLYVNTGDLDDAVSLQPLTAAFVDCGVGTDTLITPNPTVTPIKCEYVNPPAPVPVAPPTVTPVAPPLSIVQPVSTMTPRGNVPLTLSCSATGGDCVGTLVFILPKRVTKAGVHTARRGAPNIIGRERIIVRRGKKRRVKVSMTGKGRRTVRRNKRLKVTAKLRVTQNGQTTTTTQRVTIKAPRER
jgi:hypothetical protein